MDAWSHTSNIQDFVLARNQEKDFGQKNKRQITTQIAKQVAKTFLTDHLLLASEAVNQN